MREITKHPREVTGMKGKGSGNPGMRGVETVR